MLVYMIENTKLNKFYTNNGWKKNVGNIYQSVAAAQRQIDSGKLAVHIHYEFDLKADVTISEFDLTRT